MDFIPFSRLKYRLNLTDGDSFEDYPDLNELVISVKAAIEDYLGRILDVGDYTYTRLPSTIPTRMIYLDALPVNTVTSVSVDGVALTTSEYEITSYGIRLEAESIKQKIVVVYNGGLSVVPEILIRAGVIQAAYEYQSKTQVGAETINTDGGTVTRPALQLLPEVKRSLSKLRHPKEFL